VKFIDRFRKFMCGRYGIDELYSFLFYLYIILCVINLFLKSTIILTLEFLVFIIMVYRVFSKIVIIRKKENKMYLKLKDKVMKPFINIKRNLKDKEHVYVKCFKCKTTLRLPLPNKIGIKHANCPNCKRRLTFFTFKREKIEIIKDGKKYKV
jgi:hypothetical protein